MFYQPIILTKGLYSADVRHLQSYRLHWHSDLEIMYCQRGAFHVRIQEKEYRVTAGQTLFIGSTEPHEFYDCSPDNLITIIRVGSVLFGSALFMEIAKKQFETPVIENNEEIQHVCSRITALCTEKDSAESQLGLQGYIYTLVYLLILSLPHTTVPKTNKRLKYILNIQKTLDYVATHYHEEISIETAAKIAGYETNAFCRLFKQATDTSFHQYLNRYRVKKACILLSENASTITEIAESVGFPELKTFCRVFKQMQGVTPGEYRKQEEK